MTMERYEVEQKFRVESLPVVEERLQQMGAGVSEVDEQADSYFAHPARDFVSTDEALRIRSVGSLNRITYKGPRIDTTTKTRREIELQLPEGKSYAGQFAELLLVLGFTPVTAVLKKRRTATVDWRGHQVEVALDEVTQVGSFVELEVQSEKAHLAEAQAVVRSLAEKLQLDQLESRSYLEMLLKDEF